MKNAKALAVVCFIFFLLAGCGKTESIIKLEINDTAPTEIRRIIDSQ